MTGAPSQGATAARLERLLDLLGGGRPDAGAALAHVEAMLRDGPCQAEGRAAAEAVSDLLTRLLKPALAGDPDKQAWVARLDEALRAEDGSAERRAGEIRKEMAAWMAALAETVTDDDTALPRTLSGRLIQVLHLLGEGEPWLREPVARWRGQQGRAAFSWAEAEKLLERIHAAGGKPAPPAWQRQRRHLYEALIAVADGWAETLARISPEHAGRFALPDGLRRERGSAGVRALRLLLERQAAAFLTQARSLQGRVQENHQVATRLKGRLDDLEEALGAARRDQFMDPVTGLPDRFAFSAHLKRHLERAVHLGERFALALFHLHDFQEVLQTLDAAEENRLVSALASEAAALLPPAAYLARLSEERFVILFPQIDEPGAGRIALDVAGMLAGTLFCLGERRIALQPRFGATAFQPGLSAAQMLERTDRLAALAHGHGETAVTAAGAPRLCRC